MKHKFFYITDDYERQVNIDELSKMEKYLDEGWIFDCVWQTQKTIIYHLVRIEE